MRGKYKTDFYNYIIANKMLNNGIQQSLLSINNWKINPSIKLDVFLNKMGYPKDGNIGYIYMVKRPVTTTIKVGRTCNPLSSISYYEIGTKYLIIHYSRNIREDERKIINKFREIYQQDGVITNGESFFITDVDEAISLFCDILQKVPNDVKQPTMTNTQPDIIKTNNEIEDLCKDRSLLVRMRVEEIGTHRINNIGISNQLACMLFITLNTIKNSFESQLWFMEGLDDASTYSIMLSPNTFPKDDNKYVKSNGLPICKRLIEKCRYLMFMIENDIPLYSSNCLSYAENYIIALALYNVEFYYSLMNKEDISQYEYCYITPCWEDGEPFNEYHGQEPNYGEKDIELFRQYISTFDNTDYRSNNSENSDNKTLKVWLENICSDFFTLWESDSFSYSEFLSVNLFIHPKDWFTPMTILAKKN